MTEEELLLHILYIIAEEENKDMELFNITPYTAYRLAIRTIKNRVKELIE